MTQIKDYNFKTDILILCNVYFFLYILLNFNVSLIHRIRLYILYSDTLSSLLKICLMLYYICCCLNSLFKLFLFNFFFQYFKRVFNLICVTFCYSCVWDKFVITADYEALLILKNVKMLGFIINKTYRDEELKSGLII